MRNIKKFGAVAAIAAMVLTVAPIGAVSHYTAFAASNTASSVTIPTLKLTSKSTLQLKDVQFLYGTNEKTLYFTASIYNGDSKEIDFGDYMLELYTKRGSKYKLTAQESDSTDYSISPNTYKTIHFSAKVNYTATLSDFKVSVVKWDFDAPDYKRNIGSISIPTSYNPVVPAVTGRVVVLNEGKKISSIAVRSQFALVSGKYEGQIVYRVTNYSGKAIDLSTFSYYLKRSGGSLIKLDTDSEDKTLEAGETQEITLFTTFNATKLDANLQLMVTETSPTAKAETPIAMYALKPVTGNSLIVAKGKIAKLNVNGTNVNFSIGQTYFEDDNTTQTISLYVGLENTGKTSETAPQYVYSLLTSGGVSYPIEATQAEVVTLVPGIKQEKYIQFKIPSSVKADGLKLVVRKSISEDAKKNYIATIVQLPDRTEYQTSSSNTIKYVTEQGQFEFAVNKVDRVPWGSDDLINAYISIRNTQPVTKQIPNVTATLIINGQKIDEKNLSKLNTDSNNSLATNTATQIYLSTKIPYSSVLKDITVELTETTADNHTKPIGRIVVSSSKFAPTAIMNNDYITTIGTGRKAELKMKQVQTYTNETDETKLAYVEFEYTNKETRFATLPHLSAYFKMKDGNFIEADVKNVTSKITPNGTTLVMLSAELPIKYDTTDMELWIGESITGNSFTQGEAVPDGFVKVINYQLLEEPQYDTSKPENMRINPYIMSMNDFKLYQVDSDQFKIGFDYTLKKLVTYEKVAADHKLVIELVDGDNRFEQEFSLETGNEAIKLADIDRAMDVTFKDETLWGLLYRSFMINVYDEFAGNKKLLGTQVMNG